VRTDPLTTESAASGARPSDASGGRLRRTPRPFVVQVAALRKQAGATRHVLRQGPIEGLAVVGVAVPDGAEVSVDLRLSSYPGGITAAGTVSARWQGECRRCGGAVDGVVTATVREHYAPTGASGPAGGTGAPDLDEDAYPLAGDELDLEPLARDAVMLELPLAPLCSEDCLGLCPRCGENWNVTRCDCPQEGDPRWSALDVLRDPDGGGLA
jgi:uncharacterized protein